MANKGKLDGVNLISESTCAEFHSEPKVEQDIHAFQGMKSAFTKGGANFFDHDLTGSVERLPDFDYGAIADEFDYKISIDRQGFYGWCGLGGSIFQWHPELNMSFAYVPSDLLFLDMLNNRGAKLQRECL